MIDRAIQSYASRGKLSWGDMFDRLARFRQENGHCCVPQTYPQDQDLRRWLHKQRCLRKANKLPATLENKLDGMGVIWDSLEDDFHGHVHELRKFKALHGHCRVPMDYPPSPKLGKWLKGIIRKRNIHSLSKQKTDTLTSIGVEWNRRLGDEKWMAMFGELVGFAEANGHCNVPKNYPECKYLPLWIVNQKTMEANGKLSKCRKSMLSFVGVTWRVPANGRSSVSASPDSGFTLCKWEEQIRLLAEYKKKHGHCRVKAKQDKRLYCFLHRLRKRMLAGNLAPYKKFKLAEMGVFPDD
jgi:hypothetical protein